MTRPAREREGDLKLAAPGARIGMQSESAVVSHRALKGLAIARARRPDASQVNAEQSATGKDEPS